MASYGYNFGDATDAADVQIDLLNQLNGKFFIAGHAGRYPQPMPFDQIKAGFTIWLAEDLPPQNELARLANLPNYDAWLLGNEPSIGTPYKFADDHADPYQFVADRTIEQINAITAVDPHARMVLSMWHQFEMPFNSWRRPVGIDEVWKRLLEYDRSVKITQRVTPRIYGFHLHVYAEGESSVPMGEYFLNSSFAYSLIQRGLKWMRRNGVLDKKLWVTEIGLDKRYENQQGICYMSRLPEMIPPQVERVYWYCAQQSRNNEGDSHGYSLLIRDGQLTHMGMIFANL